MSGCQFREYLERWANPRSTHETFCSTKSCICFTNFIWAKLRDPKSQKRQDSEKSVGSRNLEGSSTCGRLGLEIFLLFVYFNFIFQWIDFDLEGHREVFHRVLQFPLQGHVSMLFCICISFSYFLTFHFIVDDR